MIDIKKGRYVDRIAEEWLKNVKDFFNNPRKPYIVQPNKKRLYFNSYEAKLKFECLNAVFSFTKNKAERNRYIKLLKIVWLNLDNIILAKPENIEYLISYWRKNNIWKIPFMKELADILIPYYETIVKQYGKEIIDKLAIKTCPYCNRQFIHTFKGRGIERPELDHFYPKSVYPLFCLSFYNLIPACHFCNHIKLSEGIGVNPYHRAFRGKFILTDKRGRKLTKSQIYKLTQNEIKLKFYGIDKKEAKNISIFGLEDVYNKHTDYVKELIDKSMAYDAHARISLVESFQSVGYHPRQVYDFVWGRHLRDSEYEDRPLSKLTKDILDLLDIHRR